MDYKGIKYRTWPDRSMSGPAMYRYGVNTRPGFDGWWNSEPFVSEAAAGLAARVYIDRHADTIRAAFAPRKRRRPTHGPRIVRGLRHIIALVSVEIENGSEGAFSVRQGCEPGTDDDAEAALIFLRRFCRWADAPAP